MCMCAWCVCVCVCACTCACVRGVCGGVVYYICTCGCIGVWCVYILCIVSCKYFDPSEKLIRK